MKKLDKINNSIFKHFSFEYVSGMYREYLYASYTRFCLNLTVKIVRFYEGDTQLWIELGDDEGINNPIIYSKILGDIDLLDLQAVEDFALKKCNDFLDFKLDK